MAAVSMIMSMMDMMLRARMRTAISSGKKP
jgi:hypothetical protein